jgi:hypothetical protein
MELKFLDASTQYLKYKCSIHETGKLGLNADCNTLMDITNKKFFKVAYEKDTNGKIKLYLVDSDEEPLAGKIYKAGNYYFMKLSALFDEIGLDYKSNTISFIVKNGGQYNGRDLFVLTEYSNKKREKGGDKEEGADELASLD